MAGGILAGHVIAALAAYVLCTAGYLLAASVLAFVFVRMGIGLTLAILSTASNTPAIDIIPSQRRGEGRCRHRPGHGAGRCGGCPVGDGRSVRQWQCAGAGGRCRVCFFLCPPAAGQRALVIQVLPMPADHKAHRQRSAPWR